MNFNELREFCGEEIKKFPQYEKLYLKEIYRAKIAYDNDINLFDYLKTNKEKISHRYVIPFLLGITKEVKTELPFELKQAKNGDGGKLKTTATLHRNMM